MYYRQVPRYDILFVADQLVRTMSKPSKAHMRAVKHLLHYLTGSVNFSNTYKRGGSSLLSTLTQIEATISIMVNHRFRALLCSPISFKVGLQSRPAQSTVQTDLVAAALPMKKAVFCSNITVELGFEKTFSTVPFYFDNTFNLHVVPGNRTYSPSAKHIALRYFFVQKQAEEGKIAIHYINTQSQLENLGIKHLGKHRDRVFIKRINDFETRTIINAGLRRCHYSCTLLLY